jgi:transposase
MARYKETNKKQGQFIPVIFEEQILPGTIEYAICDIIDNHVDTSVFDERYKNDSTGAPAVPPGILLKIILVCYSKGIFTSRKIEEAVRKNVTLMAVAEGLEPDHSTIAAFITSMEGVVNKLFVDVLIWCAQLDLVGGEVFALDGCKISSNAAKEYSGTFKELEKKREKLSKMLEELMNKHIQGDKRPEDIEKRKKKYEEKINKIDKFLNFSEPKSGARKRELKSNVTDNESAKMKSSHGVIQGYNGLAVVDEKTQVIVAAEAYGQGAEHNLLEPMVEQAEDNLKQAQKKETIGGSVFIADTNYFSEDNNRYCEEKKLDAYIPDQYFRNRDPRFEKDYPRRKGIRKNLFAHEDFRFDENRNCFMCPEGKKLSYDGKKNINGYKGRRYLAEMKECANCNLKPRCLKKNAGRRHLFIVDVPKPKTYSEKMMEKIDTDKGRDIYSKRMGIVEPVFANITVHKGLSRFTLRTKQKVNIQWLLYCMVHNMGKIAFKLFIFIRKFFSLLVFSRYYVIIKKCFSEYCI